MADRDKSYRDQRREREAAQLEKKYKEQTRGETLRRAKLQMESISLNSHPWTKLFFKQFV